MVKAGISSPRRLQRRRLPRRWRGLVLGGVRLHWRTRRRAYDLDRQLAEGVDPMQSDELSLRVGQLGSASTRARLACVLLGAVELASRQPDPLARRSGATEIQANRELLLRLAECVGASRPLGVEGLAMTSLIIGDSRSPLYHDGGDRSLAGAASEALVALERGHRTAGTSPDPSSPGW
ncbi:MAG: hypothetical protein ACRDL4_13835 [Thermoleophilaceae bacterium]